MAVVLLCTLTMLANCAGGKKGDVSAFVADSTQNDSDSIQQDSIDSIVENTAVPKAADEYFNDFIYSFTTSHRYQYARINFPLPRIHGNDTTFIQKKKWRFTPLHTRESIFTVFFDSKRSLNLEKDKKVEKVSIEWFYMKQNRVETFCFGKENSQWKLQAITEKPLKSYHDAAFISFYQRFATDSAFQNEHLSSEISFTAPDPDDEFEHMSGVIDSEQWPSFCPELPQDVFTNIEYGQKLKMKNRRVVALEGSSNGFQCLLFFRKSGNNWKLYRLEN